MSVLSTTVLNPAVGAGAAVVSSVGGGVSTSVKKSTELDAQEQYARAVLYQATINSVGAELASFLKLTQREFQKNSNNVIPTDEEVIQALKNQNIDLSACYKNNDFFKPKSDDLLQSVIDYFNY